jgi:VWFA-related protein
MTNIGILRISIRLCHRVHKEIVWRVPLSRSSIGNVSVGRSVWLVPAVLAGVVWVAAGQQTPPDAHLFHSAIDLTTVTATVLDHDGHLVKDLSRDAFDVYEDGQLQTVTEFTNERVPVSLGILLDISDSMFGRRIQEARDAVQRFVVDLLDPGDEFSILAFNHQPHLLTKWTSDRSAVARALGPLRPSGSTAIYDAVMSMLPLVDTRNRQRAALLVISDGADTASDVKLRDVRSALLRSDAFVYAVAIDASDPQPINTRVNPAALREITDQSGGRTEVVHSSGDVVTALAGIAEELNSQYLIGYASPKAADGQYHSIRVRVSGTDDRVRARNGYVASLRRPSPKN